MTTIPPSDYLDEAMERILEMERRAVAETKQTFPYAFAKYDNFPYWVNYPGVITPTEDTGESFDEYDYLIKMRLVVGHWTQGYEGTLERQLWRWIPGVLHYFRARTQLQYKDDQDALRYLSPRGCRIRLSRGFAVFQDSPGPHIGTEFDLILPFNVTVEPEF